jgi:ABC-type lipoprotein export system ATPase subunit
VIELTGMHSRRRARRCSLRAARLPPNHQGDAMTTPMRIAREKGSAIICVTHDRRIIEGFDHIYHVKDGLVSDEQSPGDA